MRFIKDRCLLVTNLGIEWAVLTASPIPLLLLNKNYELPFSYNIRIAAVLLIIFFSVAFAYTAARKPSLGKVFGLSAIALTYALGFNLMDTSPVYTLLGNVVFIGVFFMIIDIRHYGLDAVRSYKQGLRYTRTLWSVHAYTLLVMVVLLADTQMSIFTLLALLLSFGITQATFINWAYSVALMRNILFSAVFLILGSATVYYETRYAGFVLLVLNLLTSFILFMESEHRENANYWWDVMIFHPARILFTTFFILCLLGTALLLLPVSSSGGEISFIDAAFTSVSAVCVTGLIVLDTQRDFSFFGQMVILFLIQLGGLGIMSLSTIALQSFGKRLSLRHEALLATITETDHKSLVISLNTIIKYTFLLEFIGAVVLTTAFSFSGDSFGQAVWRGVFTAVSAFCNAGFALQSDSLIPYNGNPLILNTVAMLVILGGMSPMAAIAIPAWVRGRNVPLTTKITLNLSLVLIFGGALLMLVFEWSSSLGGMSFWDKVWNAFFQSVTLRTAGFNSVDFTNLSSPAFMLMLIFMFIGGSPGGTAGGIKTTTVGVLLLTFWSNIVNCQAVSLGNKKISLQTVSKAVTVVIAGFFVWLIAVIMMEVTQLIPSRQIIFEVTSAMGTVGLSTGATAMLDEIGKFIIILTMFLGRIGPMTLFTFLSNERRSGEKLLEESVTLT